MTFLSISLLSETHSFIFSQTAYVLSYLQIKGSYGLAFMIYTHFLHLFWKSTEILTISEFEIYARMVLGEHRFVCEK